MPIAWHLLGDARFSVPAKILATVAPQLGIAGSALANAIATLVGVAAMIGYIYWRDIPSTTAQAAALAAAIEAESLALLRADDATGAAWAAGLQPATDVVLGADPAAPSVDVMGDAVAAALRAAGIGRAVVAGLSMGGYVAMSVLARHPGLVAGLGLIDTKMTATIQALGKDELTQRILMKRLGTPEEVANVIAFLAGNEASYVTGQVWSVDGGFKLG